MADRKVYDFLGKRHIATAFSAILLAVSLVSLFVNGINYGLDFTGGTQMEVYYSEPADLDEVRGVLEQEGFQNYEVVNFGSERDVLIRIQDTGGADVDPQVAAQTGDRVVALLRQASDDEVELLRSEYVGAVVGEQLREQGGLGMLTALGMVMIYIALRFQFKFAVGAVAALAHDVIITLGFFSVLQLDFDLAVLAAVLAVVGYSLNDTIVVFDRIRENFRILRRTEPVDTINTSITQTLDRTLMTSGTTLLVLIALDVLGGQALEGFSNALIVGIVIGTYSSIFVAANILLTMQISKEDLMPPAKEKEELDALP